MTETETKYDAPAGVAVPDLGGLPQVAATSKPDEQELDAEYYDTDDLRLLRSGITLRRRRGGDDAGWHLKLPAGGDTRREIRLPLGRAARQVPGELAELVRVHTRGGPLRPVAAKPPADVLPKAARRAYRQAARRMRRARHAAAGAPRNVDLHQARKAARRARYASEAMAPAIGPKARRFAKQMKKIQSVLGEHQDAVIARRAARELGISAHLAGENAFSYGLLYERDVCAAERLQPRAQRIWKQASRRTHRRWMR